MPTTVHHYFPLGSDNVGDHLVARCIQLALTRHVPDAVFVEVPVNDRWQGGERPVGLCGENLHRTNAEADLVVVGGSNLLEPRKAARRPRSGEPTRHWGVFTSLESIEQLRPPLWLVGMGTGSGFDKPIRPYHADARAEVQRLFGRASASAVRDEATVRELSKIDIHTHCTGCPVTFLTQRDVSVANTETPLIVSFPPSRIVRRRRGRAFMRSAMRYVEGLHRSGIPVVVTLHETRDRAIIDKWLPAGVEWFQTDEVDELVARYEACRGVIGFRLHAALLALGLGKPIIPVGVDWRGLAFIETFGLEHFAIRTRGLGQFRKLRRLTKRLLDGDEELFETLSRRKAEFGRRYNAFLEGAAAALRRARHENELPCPSPHDRVIDPDTSGDGTKKRVA